LFFTLPSKLTINSPLGAGDMNTIDLIIIIPLLWGAWRGYQKGLLIEIVGVAAFIVGLIIGFKFLGMGMNFLAPHIGEQLSNRFLPYITFSIIFFPTIFLLNKMGWMLRKALRITILGTIDSFAGAMVGIFTWVFGLSTFLWLLTTMSVKIPTKETKDSMLLPYIKDVAPTVISKVSDWIPVGGNMIKKLSEK
jgi:membrane protein required for colicin V production